MNAKNIPIYIYPTDTVWGIGVSIDFEEGPDLIADTKKTERGKPLSILFRNCNQLFDYIALPKEIEKSWVEDFLKHESTLGFPVSWIKKKIPHTVYGGMPHVCCRVIVAPEIDELVSKAGAPVLTTSVNITGEKPAESYEEALSFHKNFCLEANLIELQKLTPSGHSSTMVLLNEDGSYKIIRKGFHFKKIEKLLEVFTT